MTRLRDLGKRVRDIAALPEQDEHRKIWTAVNDGKMIRPTILTRNSPVYLLEYGDELTPTIGDPFLKSIEEDLLMRLYEWEHLRCDTVVEPVVNCPAAVTDSRFGEKIASFGAAEKMSGQSSSQTAVAHHFERIIGGEEDLGLIEHPRIAHDIDATGERLDLLRHIFDGILEVKLFGINQFRFTPWDDLLTWMGMEEGMYDFLENPEFMHKAMARYVEVMIERAMRYEELGLVSSNNSNAFTGSGGYGYTSLLPKPTPSGVDSRLGDLWGSIANQVLTSVSPEMTREFAVEHEAAWTSLFGMSYYGCCERLDHKLDVLAALPGLRKVSLSPYANLEEGMEKMGGRLVVSFKPNSNYLATGKADFGYLRKELLDVCRLARQHRCSVEIIMKTIITLNGEPRRLWRWCDLARDIVDNY